MVLIAISAVNRATLRRLERNFSLIATVGACDLVHLLGAAVEIRPSSITHIFHSFSFSYTKKIVNQYSSYTNQLATGLIIKPMVCALSAIFIMVARAILEYGLPHQFPVYYFNYFITPTP
jgi:hypothetical protein